jgi:pimeloyl-ACP methyl ester carboxylesterase
VTRIVESADGRRLAVEERGDPRGLPVFLLHGTPGSRVGPIPRARILHLLGTRLLSFDRPGYGLSDRLPGRPVAAAAADVETIADAYGLDRFAVVGRSGGGPHALACAALLPERVIKAAVLVSLAPRNAEGLDWFAGMTTPNVEAYSMASADPAALAARLAPMVKRIRDDPASLFAGMEDGLSLSDRQVIGDIGIRTLLAMAYGAAVSRSGDGWYDDSLAFIAPWGFDPAEIAIPVLLWHGADDRFSPVSHTRWLAGRIRSATVAVQAGASHFSALPVLPRILGWLTGAAAWEQ